MVGAWHVLTLRSKDQRSRSRGYKVRCLRVCISIRLFRLSLFSFLVECDRLSRLFVSFLAHCKRSISCDVVYRIQSTNVSSRTLTFVDGDSEEVDTQRQARRVLIFIIAVSPVHVTY